MQVTKHLSRPLGWSLIRALVASGTLAIAGCTVPLLDRTAFLNASADPPQNLSFASRQTVRTVKSKCVSLNAAKLSPAQKDRLFQQFDDWQQDHQNDQPVKTRGTSGALGQASATRPAGPTLACLNAR